jgi:trimeric autotransporter adhesin
VAAGQTSATFTVPTSAVTSSQTLTITATYAGVALTTTLTLSPPTVTLSSLGLSSLSVTAGTSTSGVVVLSGSAPAGGVLVTLRTSGSAATVPSGVTIAAGLNAATFAVTTSAVTSTQTITITASLGSVSKTITLTVNAPPASPWALGNYTLDGTLTVEGQTDHVQIGSRPPFSFSGPNEYFGTALNQQIDAIKVAVNIIFDKGATASGNTITYTGVDSTSSTYLNSSRGALEPVISGTMTLTLSAARVAASVSGTITFATSARTLTATFTGTVQSID